MLWLNYIIMERFVQHLEHPSQEPDQAVTAVPATMVERAFQVLDLLMVANEGMGLSELARALKMGKGSMHRLLKALEHCGAIMQDEEHIFVLGPRIYKLAAFVRGTGLRRLALPAMQRLVSSIGETVFLGRVEQEHVHILETVEAGGEYLYPHVSVPRGTRVPFISAATGRLVLASWSAEQRRHWLQKHELPRFTEASITDSEQFLKEVEKTATTGLAIDHGEYLAGVNAIGVPITGPQNALIAVLCVLGFATHFNDDAMQRAGALLKGEAENISHSLGT